MNDIDFALSPALSSIVRPGVLAFDGLRVAERDTRLDAALTEAEERLRREPPAGREGVRSMYRRTGLDPTRRRPSSEALLRRVLRGETLPRINVLVDVCNWCSVEFQLPYGLYDLDRVDGPIVLRIGREGEEYGGIRKDAVHVSGRLVLADETGPFGNPSADSARTMAGTATTRALVVVFAPAGTPSPRLDQVLTLTSARIVDQAGGRERARIIV